MVWAARPEPFGQTVPNEDPDGDGIGFAFNLRLPGQYFDAETGLHYNYFRTYDPATGRYIESDPIGLAGGLNPYLYAAANPLRYIDPLGLSWDDPYPTLEAARMAAACDDLYQMSQAMGIEFSTVIYEKDGSYSYTFPNIGISDSVNPVPTIWPTGPVTPLEIMHSHGIYDPTYGRGNDQFSPQDKKAAKDFALPAVLVDTKGGVQQYDPNEGKPKPVPVGECRKRDTAGSGCRAGGQ